MASAFISYAHEDQTFVLALVERLEAQGLDIRYDAVALHIGDSLIRTLSQEIIDGDFLIAVVSPDSVQSEWCQTELALAKTQGHQRAAREGAAGQVPWRRDAAHAGGHVLGRR